MSPQIIFIVVLAETHGLWCEECDASVGEVEGVERLALVTVDESAARSYVASCNRHCRIEKWEVGARQPLEVV